MKTIVHIIASLGEGGAQAALHGLCTQDPHHRHHVISLMEAGRYGALLQGAGVRVTAIGLPRGRLTLSGLARLVGVLRALRPDLVQTWMYHADLLGGIAARLAGVGQVVWGIHHSTLHRHESRRSTRWVARGCAGLSRLVPSQIICCAQSARLAHAALGYDAGRMRVIPNGYDLRVFRPDPQARHALRQALALPDGRPVIGFVARFHPAKDHHTLLRAVQILNHRGCAVLCLLVGAGMERDTHALTRMIEGTKTAPNLRLLGARGDIPAVMNALDLHVMSSVSEGFPNVLAEAMACGTPCVSTDVGDAAAIIGATGLIVPPGDPMALADAIAAMLAARQADGWAERRRAARARIADHFSLERMVAAYAEVWDTPLAKARPCLSST